MVNKRNLTKLQKKKSNNGITLVALVITIIVLLILAGITVASLMGENGLLTKADKANIETRKAGYEEELKIIGNGLKIDKQIEGWDNKKYIDEFEKEIRKDEQFKEANITRKDDTTVEVITKEGYVFVIEGENVEYKGTQGEDVPPDLQEGDIEFNATPSEWTNSSVTVKIAIKVEGYILQYSLDGSIWQDYKEAGITVTDNTAIYARMINNIGETGGTATGNIENIDRLEPNTFKPTATSTTNSITLTGSTTDQAKTNTNGSSGIAKYYFSKDNGATWEPKDGQTGTSYTFNNLTQTKDYSLKMKAVDNAGNETITDTVNKGTGTVEGLISSNVTFTCDPSEWTRGSVSVTINTTVTGYTLQYSTDGTKWDDYTTAIPITDSGAIYARLWDGTNAGGYATGNVENIDRLEPNTFTPTATSTTNSITLTGSTTDQEKTATNGSSGIAKYYFSNDNGVTWLPQNGQTTTSYTFNNLTQNKTYSLKMKAVDNAGNETITETLSKSTGTVQGLTSSNVTFANNPSTWTKGSVSVSISTTVTGYTLQYSIDGTNWDDYTTAITRTDNGAVYARLWDGTNAGGTATGNVTNIDKLVPNTFTPTATSASNTITLTGSTTDQAKTATNGSSGIAKYYFSKDNGTTWEPTNGQTGTSYTFSSVSGGTTYNLKMKAVDNAGNETITNTVSKKAEGVWLPTGATVLENNINKGLVIKDSNNNEWVWIEVPKSIYTTAKSSTDYANIENDMQNYAKEYRVPDWLGNPFDYEDTFYSTEQHGFANATEYNNWKNSMLESVFTNGGFYIGRYEIGTNTTRMQDWKTWTSPSTIEETPHIKQDMYPYNYITCSQAQTLAKQLATGGKRGSLMFGIQWDLVMKFIETKGGKTQSELKDDSITWGNYFDATFSLTRGKYLIYGYGEEWNNITTYTKQPEDKYVLLSTGATTRNSTLNIYDLAGNVMEWTLEYSSNTSLPCHACGGNYTFYGNTNPASQRIYGRTSDHGDYNGARSALW